MLKVAQNAKYDMAVLSRYGVRVAPIEDTMLMSYVLDAGVHNHGMDELSQLHLGHAPIPFKQVAGTGKKQVSFAEVELKPATAYAAEDADVTLRLYHALKPRLQKERLLTVYETLERPMPQVLATMEAAGIKVDPDRLRQLSHEFGIKMVEAEGRAHQLAGHPFNLGSPKQIGDVLFGEMGLPGAKKTATGAWSTDVKVLEDLALQGHALPRAILDWRQISKLKGTYADALVTAVSPATGRVHTSFALASTTTGRLSSSDPNLQNIPVRTEEGRKLRTCFIAEPGHVIVSADYSQIELRLLAHIGDIPQLKEAFRKGQDIHAMTASEMFGVPIEGMDPRRAPPRQGDQLRHRLRHLGLRPVQPARHPPGRGRRLHPHLFRALPRHPRLHGPHPGLRARARLRHHPVRPAHQHPRHPLQGRWACASSPSAPPSTPPSRAPPPTSSAAP